MVSIRFKEVQHNLLEICDMRNVYTIIEVMFDITHDQNNKEMSMSLPSNFLEYDKKQY